MDCRLCEEHYPLISMTNGICSMCMQLHSKAEIIGMLEEQEGTMEEVLVNKVLIDKLLEETRQLKIMTKRYNYVVDLLNEYQQELLQKWYVDTKVLQPDVWELKPEIER